jgi:hypothetical protein
MMERAPMKARKEDLAKKDVSGSIGCKKQYKK